MYSIFIIPGYGIPKDIRKDGNLQAYLRFAFNAIYRDSLAHPKKKIIMVFSGGKTGMVRPYTRTEASELARAFRHFMSTPVLRSRTRAWKLLLEPRSISSLENLLSVRGLLKSRGIVRGEGVVFCEWTRQEKLKKLLARVFNKSMRITVHPIDFDTSANRYLDPDFLAKKDRLSLAHDLWALMNDDNLQEHHALYRERLTKLRRVGLSGHVDAVRQWWEKEMKAVEQKAVRKTVRR